MSITYQPKKERESGATVLELGEKQKGGEES